MKKIMIAALGLSLLSGTAVFAQNTSGGGQSGQSGTDAGTMKSGKKHKKNKKGNADTGTSGGTTSNPK
jgi:hypothetical protein